MHLTEDEKALIMHIRELRKTVAGIASQDPGEQLVVLVVTLTQRYTFWRIASNLETSEYSRRELGIE